MSFNVEITPRKDAKGAIVHAVLVTIDGHETVLNFVSKDDAESFAQRRACQAHGERKECLAAGP